MSQLIPKSTRLIVDNFCGNCGNDLRCEDNFCRHCGTPAHHSDEPVSATIVTVGPKAVSSQTDQNSNSSAVANRDPSSPASTLETILNNRLYVSLVIALIGPLGLPALWFSPRFSQRTKIISTCVFVFMTTVVPLVAAWYFLDYSLRPLVDAFGR